MVKVKPKLMKDALGNRIKNNYENRTRIYLPRRTYTILRLDGKAFHTYTKGFQRPFDHRMMGAIDRAVIDLSRLLEGIRFAYAQSDEVSILLTDFTRPETEAWFDGNLQKLVSISASALTAYFNEYMGRFDESLRYKPLGLFDCRAFTIPDPVEVENYFIWRQQDWIRNSLQAVAQSVYSHKELHKKNTTDLHEMLFQKGINWAKDYSNEEKNGRIIKKRDFDEYWVSDMNTPVFTQDRDYLKKLIPNMHEGV